MTSADDPDQIRAEIERTQTDLSRDVDAFTDKVSPGRIVERRVDRVRGTAGRWKESVMGSSGPGTTGSGGGHAGTGMRDGVQDAAGSVAGAAQDAPQAARRRTQGNPLAAGLIAFGAGMLVSSLLPASQSEQHAAGRAKERAGELGQPVADAAKQAASEVRDNLQEPAQQAVSAVRSSAADAGNAVADDGRTAAQEVRGQAQDSTASVREGGR